MGVCDKGWGVIRGCGTTPPEQSTTSLPPPLGQRTTPPHDTGNMGIRSMCGRYASYWNALLLDLFPDKSKNPINHAQLQENLNVITIVLQNTL